LEAAEQLQKLLDKKYGALRDNIIQNYLAVFMLRTFARTTCLFQIKVVVTQLRPKKKRNAFSVRRKQPGTQKLPK
jgi:hypothetical protein